MSILMSSSKIFAWPVSKESVSKALSINSCSSRTLMRQSDLIRNKHGSFTILHVKNTGISAACGFSDECYLAR